MEGAGREKPYTVKRYITRLFIPLAVVAGAGALLRWQAKKEFNENNVSLSEEVGTVEIGDELSFSEANRSHLINGLEYSWELLESSGEKPSEVTKEKLERLRDRIDRLVTVEEEGWENAVEDAYEALAALRRPQEEE